MSHQVRLVTEIWCINPWFFNQPPEVIKDMLEPFIVVSNASCLAIDDPGGFFEKNWKLKI